MKKVLFKLKYSGDINIRLQLVGERIGKGLRDRNKENIQNIIQRNKEIGKIKGS